MDWPASSSNIGGTAAARSPRLRRRRSSSQAERRRHLATWVQQNGVLFALLLMCGFFVSRSDRFLTRGNINIVLLQVAVTGIIAVPAGLLILAGYVDLSVGSVMVLSSVAFGQVFKSSGSVTVSILVAVVVGIAWGLTSGFFVSFLGFSPIVVTLGGLAAARGFAQVWSQSITVSGFGDTFGKLGTGRWFDTPIPIYVAAVVLLMGFYAWNQSAAGRHLAAIGSDEVAARALGVRTKLLPFLLYGLSGLAAAIGGLIVTSQLDGASVSIGQGEELTVLTAVLLGGVSFKGGRGSLLGVLSGLLFLGSLRNGLILLKVGTFWQQVAVGTALFFAAALDVLYQRLERVALEKAADSDDVDYVTEASGAN